MRPPSPPDDCHRTTVENRLSTSIVEVHKRGVKGRCTTTVRLPFLRSRQPGTLPSTAAAIEGLTCGGRLGTLVRQGAAASRSCVRDNNKTEGRSGCQHRGRARGPGSL